MTQKNQTSSKAPTQDQNSTRKDLTALAIEGLKQGRIEEQGLRSGKKMGTKPGWHQTRKRAE